MDIRSLYPFYHPQYSKALNEDQILEELQSPDSCSCEYDRHFYQHCRKEDVVFFFADMDEVVINGNKIYYKCGTKAAYFVRELLANKKIIVLLGASYPSYDFYGVYKLEPIAPVPGTYGAIDPSIPLLFVLQNEIYDI